MERAEAAEWLGETRQLQRQTRRASRRYWFPLTLFGLVTVGATPLYVEKPASGLVRESYVGGFFVSRPERLSLYSLLACAAGYAATVLYYRWRDRTSGVTSSVWPFVATGGALFVLLIAVSPGGLALIGLSGRLSPWWVVGDLFIRGLTPVLTIALGLLVLAAFERRPAFAIFCVAFAGVALLVNLYDVGNLTYRLGLGQHGLEANILLAGAVLIAGGIGFRVVGRGA